MREASKMISLYQSIPAGYCQCGCGKRTNISTQNDAKTARVLGMPMRFVSGHNERVPGVNYVPKVSSEAPLCECGCGKRTRKARYTAATLGIIKGQYLRFVRGHGHSKGGLSGTPEMRAYNGAKKRCDAIPGGKDYKDYAGRGIRFLFISFDQWFTELGPRPSPNHSVDRINNDGHYELGNVRWALPEEQGKNRRKPKYDRETILRMHAMRQKGLTLQEIAGKFGTTKQYVWIVLRVASEFIPSSST